MTDITVTMLVMAVVWLLCLGPWPTEVALRRARALAIVLSLCCAAMAVEAALALAEAWP